MCTEHQRGHHNNNFAQVMVHLYKDVVPGGSGVDRGRDTPPPPTENEKERERGCGPWLHKVYNVIAVVDFTVRVMEEYYCTRLSDFANGCVSAQQLLAEKLQTKASYLSDCDQITIISQQLASSE